MRKILISLLVSLSFVLVGCGDEKVDYDSAATGPDAEEIYLDMMREEIPELRSVSDSMILDNAKAFCELFDVGGTFEDAYIISTESGMTSHQTGILIGGAVAYECPEHKDILN